MKNKRWEQKEQTRKRLIAAAFAQFAKEGLLAAKTSEIAATAGVAHGTVFVHFPTRETLLISTIQEFGAKITGRIHELAGAGGNLRQVLEAHLNGLIENETFYYRLVTEGQLLPAEARYSLIMIQSAVSHHLILAAERGMAAGKIRRIPMHLLFNTWIGLIHYYLANREFFAGDGPVLAKYGKELLDHYLSLISLQEQFGYQFELKGGLK